jgi:hypothetical protein
MVKKKHKTKKISIHKIFLGLQDQMRAKLSLNRKILTHPVTKGDASELEWIEMLSTYLPQRYRVDKAFVIDCKGMVSEQIDIVIYDRQYSPFLFRQNGATYIPAESVYAIIEVKPTLYKTTIDYASKKAQSVRLLHRTSAPIVHAGGKIETPKKPFNLLAGILTIDGSCTDKLKDHLKKKNPEKFLNFGCSLDKNSFWFRTKRDGKIYFEKSKNGEALIFFFLNLLAEFQQLGTVSAIDVNSYIDKFKKI